MSKVMSPFAAVTRQVKSLLMIGSGHVAYDPYDPNPMEKPFSAMVPVRATRGRFAK